MMADHGETALIHAVQSGSEDAFNELYERYYRLVYFIAYELRTYFAPAVMWIWIGMIYGINTM